MSEPEEKVPDNILEFKPRPEGEMPVEIKRWSYDDHVHGSFLIDVREREVLCRRCGKLVDPFTALSLIGEHMADVKYKWDAYQAWSKKQHEEFVRKEKKREERRKGATML